MKEHYAAIRKYARENGKSLSEVSVFAVKNEVLATYIYEEELDLWEAEPAVIITASDARKAKMIENVLGRYIDSAYIMEHC